MTVPSIGKTRQTNREGSEYEKVNESIADVGGGTDDRAADRKRSVGYGGGLAGSGLEHDRQRRRYASQLEDSRPGLI